MTFEEFFVKKRIDLSKFEQDNPSLLAEMRGHYEQMGSKSFDHSKKFWFNKLRHLYLLVQPIPSVKTETAIPAAGTINQDAQKATPEAAPAGFKPRFKPRAAAAPAPEPQKDSEPAPSDSVAELEKTEPASTAQVTPAPAGFKPRFKPRAAAAPAPEPQKDSEPAPSDSVAELEKTEPASTAQVTPAPTGFKPRFKPRAAAAPTTDPQKDSEPADKAPADTTEAMANEQAKNAAAAPAPTGFKPRFRAPKSQLPALDKQTDKDKQDGQQS